MQPKERIDRINHLAKKAKREGLTTMEKQEQKKLREEYLKTFRKNFRGQLDRIKFED
ncbi:DUF896 domain-containing protein [Wukongibacter sp. M2B1]|uniref:DUF896 domain-containing protein n=1 Tax=Wukongibacter sp. M2B1 TaxID=3088895 RepID=UPI003D7AD59B